MDDALTSLVMASPRMKATSSGSGAFDFSTAMSNQESEKEDEMLFKRKIETFIRAVYYLLNSLAHQTSLEIREFTLPGPGSC
jgi:hypothetical protein